MPDSKLHTPEVQAKVNILMREYDGLRTEIQNRLNNRFAMVGYFGAIFTYALLQKDVDISWRLAWGVGAVLCLAGVWLRGAYMITRCARRIAQIEEKVNSFSDEPLLVWEISQHEVWGSRTPPGAKAGQDTAARIP